VSKSALKSRILATATPKHCWRRNKAFLEVTRFANKGFLDLVRSGNDKGRVKGGKYCLWPK